MDDWFRINNIDSIDTPALVVYRQRVIENISKAVEMAGEVNRLRPHVKTHKSKEVAALMLQAGITKFKCATIAEAEMLAMINAPDVLLAYQPVGPKVKRFISLIKQYPYTKFSSLVDDLTAATILNDEAVSAGINVAVHIDVNIGMDRTGIIPEQVIGLYEKLKTLTNISIQGLHAYDGHITDIEFEARKEKADAAFYQTDSLRTNLQIAGATDLKIIIGGSPTFSVHVSRTEVECSPGTFVYWDYGYASKYQEQKFKPAALVLSRVISLPGETIVCTDLGHKSVAAENDISSRVHFLNASDLIPVGQSEEHLKLKADKKHSFKTGDVLYGMPIHICPTVALYQNAIIIENGEAIGNWETTARSRKINT